MTKIVRCETSSRMGERGSSALMQTVCPPGGWWVRCSERAMAKHHAAGVDWLSVALLFFILHILRFVLFFRFSAIGVTVGLRILIGPGHGLLLLIGRVEACSLVEARTA